MVVGACGFDFGEPEMKAFIRHSKNHARKLEAVLKEVKADYKIVLLHYSPTAQTLSGEKKEIYPFLGSYFLAEAIDYSHAFNIYTLDKKVKTENLISLQD